jgi:hypothetical protein
LSREGPEGEKQGEQEKQEVEGKGTSRREKGEGRREKGEGRREKGEGRREKGEGRRLTSASSKNRAAGKSDGSHVGGDSVVTGLTGDGPLVNAVHAAFDVGVFSGVSVDFTFIDVWEE